MEIPWRISIILRHLKDIVTKKEFVNTYFRERYFEMYSDNLHPSETKSQQRHCRKNKIRLWLYFCTQKGWNSIWPIYSYFSGSSTLIDKQFQHKRVFNIFLLNIWSQYFRKHHTKTCFFINFDRSRCTMYMHMTQFWRHKRANEYLLSCPAKLANFKISILAKTGGTTITKSFHDSEFPL